MFLTCSYPWQQSGFQESTPFIFVSMDTFNTQRWFVSNNRISAETCLPSRFLETAYMSQYYVLLWLYSPFLGHGRFFSFSILYTVDRIPWTGDQPVARPLHTHTTQTQNKRTRISVSRVGFESTTPVSEWAQTVHASDRVTTVIGIMWLIWPWTFPCLSPLMDSTWQLQLHKHER
jgi:hypothetical protein